jgi:endoglucanase
VSRSFTGQRTTGAFAITAVLVALAAALTIVASSTAALRHGRELAVAQSFGSPQCRDPYSSSRTPGNPLMLKPAPTAGNPLQGARFFVDGPKHGSAAGAIARLLGIDTGTPEGSQLPSFSATESWTTFSRYVAKRLKRGVGGGTAYQIHMLEKIASQPEAQRISTFSQGGTPSGIYAQTQKLFCQLFVADPGTIPIISTYFLHGKLKGCPSVGEMNAYRPLFQQQIEAIAQATGNRPVVFLLELDYVGSSACIEKTGGMSDWESLMRFEASTLSKLPHAAVYIEGGYSDANTASYAARVLNASGLRQVAGFFTNDTHLNWSINEVHYGQKISKLTGGANFIVDTADNGQGPLRNPHPVTEGVENLCNPPGRGLGIQTTSTTGFAHVSAFMWTHVPGNSSGCGGGPPGGVFWPARAVSLAAHANGKLGPGYPSKPY